MVKFIVQLVLTIFYFIDYVESYVIISEYYISVESTKEILI